MKIVEIFESVQGEGLHTGLLVTFVRLAGCNLSCEFCDTKNSWNTFRENYLPQEVFLKIQQNRAVHKNVVFTGGEPLLQKKELSDLIKLCLKDNYEIQIETNGTVNPYLLELPNEDLKKIFFSVSPKLSPMLPSFTYKVYYEEFVTLKGQFKFVVNNDAISTVKRLIQKHCLYDHPIVLQPECHQYEHRDYVRNYGKLVEVVKEVNFGTKVRVLPQLHKLIWGDKQQV